MALSRDKLQDIAYLAASAAPILTNPAATNTYIRGVTLFNSNSASELVRLYVVPDAAGAVGVASAGNQILEYGMAAKETLILDLDYPIVFDETNETLQGFSTTANKVTVLLHGDQDP